MAAAGGAVATLPAHSEDDGEPAFSAAGGRGLLRGPSVATGAARRGIWVRNLATGAVTQVTRRGTDPEWSSRNWIAFEHGGQIWRVRPGGRGLEQLTGRGGISPAWSPDGTKLAFVRHGTIVVLDLRTRRLARAFGGNSPVDLAWSPDGRRLAWTSFDGSLYTARTNGAEHARDRLRWRQRHVPLRRSRPRLAAAALSSAHPAPVALAPPERRESAAVSPEEPPST